MGSDNPKNKFFNPKKPVIKKTYEELDEFAIFVFGKIVGDITDKKEPVDCKETKVLLASFFLCLAWEWVGQRKLLTIC